MTKTINNSLFDNPDLAQFYDLPNRWETDFDYCLALAKDAKSVLDLGCGTGELSASLANGRQVTGVDPAAAMLDIARKRTHGDKVDWVKADARSVRLGKKFDQVTLTGHAFQVFLTKQDQIAVLETIAAHLNPDGRFFFDSRNPDFEESKERNLEHSTRRFEHPEFGQINMWNKSNYDESSGILTYTNGYIIASNGKEYSESAQIRYTSRQELAAMISKAGLKVERWLGDWKGTPFHAAAREIIPIGGLA